MRRPTPPPVVRPVALAAGTATVGRATVPLSAQTTRASDLLALLQAHELMQELSLTPLASDGSEVSDLASSAACVASVRLALQRGERDRRCVAPKNGAVDEATQAVVQRPAYRSVTNRLPVEEGDVVTILRALDDDWLECECDGRKGRLLRTVLYDNTEVTFDAEWRESGLAQWDLGWRIIKGWSGLAADQARGVAWIERGVAQNHILCVYSMGEFLRNGRLLPDEARSRRLLEQCVAAGHPFAFYDIGCDLMGEDKDEEGFRLFLAAAEAGLPMSMNAVGFCYRKGVGTARDFNLALYWQQRAYEEGHVAASHEVGLVYRDLGDTPNAVEWFTKGADRNDIDSVIELGLIYIHTTVEGYREPMRGRALLLRAAAAGELRAIRAVAKHYYQCGEYTEALRWFEANEEAAKSPYRALCYSHLCPDVDLRRKRKLS